MANIVISGDSSGSVTLSAPAVSGTTVLTLPTTSGTLIVSGGAQTIEFADGSASAPSITNSGDTNTGIFFPAADSIGFTEGGAEVARFDSSGQFIVGPFGGNGNAVVAGSSSPSFTNQPGTNLLLKSGDGSGTGSSFMSFSTSPAGSSGTTVNTAVERMRIDSSGNVGIGTSSPQRKFEVHGTPASIGGTATGMLISVVNNNTAFNASPTSGMSFFTRFNSSGSNFPSAALQGGKENTTDGNYAGFMSFFTTDGGGGVNETMRITSTGNVGIGTTNPGGGASGATRILNLRTGSTAGTSSLTFGDSNAVGFVEAVNGNSCVLNINSGGIITFGTSAPTERMRILSTGEVVVGKTNNDNFGPGIGLSLQQSNAAPLLKMVKTFSGGINSLVNWHNGTYVGGIDFNNTSTSFPTSSDIRLKKNIVNAGSATEKIDQIRIVSHGWKHDADELVEFGIIAQELYAVAPQAVTKGDDGEEIEKTWGVDYSKLVPLLLKAHQEQQAIITQLQADVAALKGAK
jgi:hypothetical protein